MKDLQSTTEYRRVVECLADEFATEIDNGFADNVARHMLAGFYVRDHEVHVTHGAEYEGGEVTSLEETLCPYDVLNYSEASIRIVSDNGGAAYDRAAQCLSRDLLEAREVW